MVISQYRAFREVVGVRGQKGPNHPLELDLVAGSFQERILIPASGLDRRDEDEILGKLGEGWSRGEDVELGEHLLERPGDRSEELVVRTPHAANEVHHVDAMLVESAAHELEELARDHVRGHVLSASVGVTEDEVVGARPFAEQGSGIAGERMNSASVLVESEEATGHPLDFRIDFHDFHASVGMVVGQGFGHGVGTAAEEESAVQRRVEQALEPIIAGVVEDELVAALRLGAFWCLVHVDRGDGFAAEARGPLDPDLVIEGLGLVNDLVAPGGLAAFGDEAQQHAAQENQGRGGQGAKPVAQEPRIAHDGDRGQHAPHHDENGPDTQRGNEHESRGEGAHDASHGRQHRDGASRRPHADVSGLDAEELDREGRDRAQQTAGNGEEQQGGGDGSPEQVHGLVFRGEARRDLEGQRRHQKRRAPRPKPDGATPWAVAEDRPAVRRRSSRRSRPP